MKGGTVRQSLCTVHKKEKIFLDFVLPTEQVRGHKKEMEQSWLRWWGRMLSYSRAS